MKRTLVAAAVACALTAAIASAHPLKGAELSKYASVSLGQARAVALKTVRGGTIVDEELEREAGGSGLRYSFDVKIGKTVREVGVDAKTGKVLENSIAGND